MPFNGGCLLAEACTGDPAKPSMLTEISARILAIIKQKLWGKR
jgi:hypothetical protein